MNTIAGRQQPILAGVSTDERVTSIWKSGRLYIVILPFAAQIINYIDRVNLSVAAPLISKEFGWDPATMGIIFSSFLWTYVLCLVPWGWVTDIIGARKVNSLAISVWSLAAMLTGLVTSFTTMLPVRLALGVGESAVNPSAGKVIRDWFPVKERGFVSAIQQCGGFAGPAIGMPLVAWLVVATGWRASFLIAGAIGFVWLIFWLKYFHDLKDCTWLRAQEREYILANNASRETPPDSSGIKGSTRKINIIGRLFRQRTMWGLALPQGCIIYSLYLFISRLPSYLVQAKHFSLMKAGLFATLPYVIAVILGILFGKISDSILTPENVVRGGRRKLVIAFLLLSSVVLFTTFVDNEYIILALISLCLSAIASAVSLNYNLANDLTKDPAIAGSVFGILILGGNSFGLMAPIVTGFIVKATGSFSSAFFLAGVILIAGALVSLTLTKEPIDLRGLA